MRLGTRVRLARTLTAYPSGLSVVLAAGLTGTLSQNGAHAAGVLLDAPHPIELAEWGGEVVWTLSGDAMGLQLHTLKLDVTPLTRKD